MKRALVLIIFFFIPLMTFAQQSYRDVIYLKNAGIIKGIIIEKIHLKI